MRSQPALGAPEAGQARQEGEEAPGGAAGGAAAGGAVVAATEGGAPEEPPADGRSGKKGGSGKGKAKGAKAGGAEEAVGRVPRHDRATPVLSPNKDSAHLPSKRKAAGAAEAGEERSQDTDGGRVRKSKRLRERQPENPAEGGAEDDDSRECRSRVDSWRDRPAMALAAARWRGCAHTGTRIGPQLLLVSQCPTLRSSQTRCSRPRPRSVLRTRRVPRPTADQPRAAWAFASAVSGMRTSHDGDHCRELV